jgi:hypothetical protein
MNIKCLVHVPSIHGGEFIGVGGLWINVFFSGKISQNFDPEYVPSTYKPKKKAKIKV